MSEALKKKLSRDARRRQLLATAREMIRESGTDEFTLGRLAERAGVTKPIAYDHFGDRNGALVGLYQEFEEGQREALRVALEGADQNLVDVANVIGAAYVRCSLTQGRELASVIGALATSPSLVAVREEAEHAYLALCQKALTPLAGPADAATLRALVGSGDALSRAVLEGRIGAERASVLLGQIIYAINTDQPFNSVD